MEVTNLVNKEKASTILMLSLLTLSILSVFAIPVNAPKVTTPPILDWIPPSGQAVHDSLECDPEWLKVRTNTYVSHDTTIIVHGKDTFDQDIEAKALIEEGTPAQIEFPLIDVHSGENVTFAKITGVYQQGGEHCNAFEIHTMVNETLIAFLPVPWQQLLGMYHNETGYEPELDASYYPVEPYNPAPLKVVINWHDSNGDGQPSAAECSPASVDTTITIKGLDQHGNPLEQTVNIPAGSRIVPVDILCHTWSTVCTVRGGEMLTGISYFIFTHPNSQRGILKYRIAVDHIEVTADPKNILADGTSTSTITITLLDIDGHEVHWSTVADPVEINVAATGGKVKPSLGITIKGCHTYNITTLISDTNARIVNVTALAIIPAVGIHPEKQLFAWDIVCFDGLNSVPYKSAYGIIDIGGVGTGKHYAVFIRLNEGCNFISIPVVPDEHLSWDMLPCAGQCLISVAAYQGGAWLYYDYTVPAGDIISIKDGCGYWVKAEKPCTLVISGKSMDQYDPITHFGLPPMYPMALGWNMIGVTSLRPIPTADYFESLHDMSLGEKLWGPAWVFRNGKWLRNPASLKPTEAVWLFTYDGILAP